MVINTHILTIATTALILALPISGMLPTTELHRAASTENVDSVGELLWAHADVHAKDGLGNTPLHLAADGKIARALIEAGARPNAASDDGLTPLHYAVLLKRVEVMQELMQAGADIHAREAEGNTSAHLTVFFLPETILPLQIGNLRTANANALSALLAAGADLEAVNHTHQTPLELAACEENGDPRQALAAGAEMTSEAPFNIPATR